MHECIRELQVDVVFTFFATTNLQWRPHCLLGTRPGSFGSYLLEVSPALFHRAGAQWNSSARAGIWDRNVAVILMTLLICLVDGIQNVMGIHLSSSHYPSAVYCQGNKQSGANISFCC